MADSNGNTNLSPAELGRLTLQPQASTPQAGGSDKMLSLADAATNLADPGKRPFIQQPKMKYFSPQELLDVLKPVRLIVWFYFIYNLYITGMDEIEHDGRGDSVPSASRCRSSRDSGLPRSNQDSHGLVHYI